MIRFFIFILIIGILVSCGKNIDNIDTTSPDKTVFRTQSKDQDFYERGIDAVSDGNSIYLNWQKNDAEDLKGYNIYRGEFSWTDQDTTWSEITTQMLSKDDTTYTDNSDLELDKTYFYRITAQDENDNKSLIENSSECQYILLEKVIILKFEKVNQDSIHIKWKDNGDYTKNYYILKFYNNTQLTKIISITDIITEPENEIGIKINENNINVSNLSLRIDVGLSSYLNLVSPKGSESAFKALENNKKNEE